MGRKANVEKIKAFFKAIESGKSVRDASAEAKAPFETAKKWKNRYKNLKGVYAAEATKPLTAQQPKVGIVTEPKPGTPTQELPTVDGMIRKLVENEVEHTIDRLCDDVFPALIRKTVEKILSEKFTA